MILILNTWRTVFRSLRSASRRMSYFTFSLPTLCPPVSLICLNRSNVCNPIRALDYSIKLFRAATLISHATKSVVSHTVMPRKRG